MKSTVFKNLVKNTINFLVSPPKIFGKNFIKNRYYLHFFLTLGIVLALMTFSHLFMAFYPPVIVALVAGWFLGHTINLIREGYLEDRGRAVFDWNDVFAGAWGGIVASIFFIIFVKI